MKNKTIFERTIESKFNFTIESDIFPLTEEEILEDLNTGKYFINYSTRTICEHFNGIANIICPIKIYNYIEETIFKKV